METDYSNQLPTGVIINGQALTSSEVLAVARYYAHVALGDESILRIRAARTVIDTISAENQKVYGVTTGFGHLSRVRIPQDQLEELQHNLLRSHSAGVGEPLSEEITRAMVLLLAASLGGVESLVILPIYSSHYNMTNEELRRAGVSPGTVRVSIGLEDKEDLIEDLEQALG